jgi:hypothetical protein
MAFQELLRAATTISNTEIGEEDISYLLDHRTEFENAFAKLHTLLGSSSAVIRSVSAASPTDERPVSPACPSFPTTEQHPSVGATLPHDISERFPPIPTPQHTTVDMEAVPDSVQELIGLLEKRKKSISNFTYRSKANLNISPGNDADDPRITIIKFVSQKRTQAHYYLAGHAALSLAEDFLLWQGADGSPTRLDILSDNIDNLGGEGYRDYADACPEFMDKDSAEQYTRFGVKLLFFELLCLVRYKVSITCAGSDSDALFPISVSKDSSSLNNTPDPVGSGASLHKHAVVYPLFFVWRAFYRCKYGDLPALANALLSLQFWGEWTEKKKDWPNTPFTETTPFIESAPHSDKRPISTDQAPRKRQKHHRREQSHPCESAVLQEPTSSDGNSPLNTPATSDHQLMCSLDEPPVRQAGQSTAGCFPSHSLGPNDEVHASADPWFLFPTDSGGPCGDATEDTVDNVTASAGDPYLFLCGPDGNRPSVTVDEILASADPWLNPTFAATRQSVH